MSFLSTKHASKPVIARATRHFLFCVSRRKEGMHARSDRKKEKKKATTNKGQML